MSLLNLPTHDFDGWGGFLTCGSTKIAWVFSLDDLFGPLLIIFSPAFLGGVILTIFFSIFPPCCNHVPSFSPIFLPFSCHFPSHFPVKKKAPSSTSQVVRAWDVRDVSDQVHSMGAKWVTVDFKVPVGARCGGTVGADLGMNPLVVTFTYGKDIPLFDRYIIELLWGFDMMFI